MYLPGRQPHHDLLVRGMAEQGASNGGGDREAPRGDVGFAGIDALERIALTVGVAVDAVARAATLPRDGVISSAMTSSRSIRAARPPRACSSSSLRKPASSSTARDARHASPYSYSSTSGADEASTSPSQKVNGRRRGMGGGSEAVAGVPLGLDVTGLRGVIAALLAQPRHEHAQVGDSPARPSARHRPPP